MTRLAILSDIHGNLPALEAVIADMQQFAPDHVIVAGDLINIAPFSAQVMETVTRLGWTAIRGNHEFYLLDYQTPRQPAHWGQWVLLPWLKAQLAGKWHHYIAAMPDTLTLYYADAPPVRIAHGLPHTPWNAIEPYLPEEKVSEWLAGVEETTYIAGHYHIAFERWVGKWHILNPGSLGVPLDGIRKANYLILDGDETGWHPTFRRVDYDVQRVLAAFHAQNFIQNYGAMGYTALLQFPTARPTINSYMTWHETHHAHTESTVALVDEFLHSGEFWQFTSPIYKVNEHLLPDMLTLI